MNEEKENISKEVSLNNGGSNQPATKEEQPLDNGGDNLETDYEVIQEEFDNDLVREGLDDRAEAKKYKEVFNAKKPIILTDKEFDNGKLSNTTQHVEYVPDYTIQIQALKMISTMRGRFEEKKKTLDARRVQGKIFTIKKAEPTERVLLTPSPSALPQSHSSETLPNDEASSSTPQPEHTSSQEAPSPGGWTL